MNRFTVRLDAPMTVVLKLGACRQFVNEKKLLIFLKSVLYLEVSLEGAATRKDGGRMQH